MNNKLLNKIEKFNQITGRHLVLDLYTSGYGIHEEGCKWVVASGIKNIEKYLKENLNK